MVKRISRKSAIDKLVGRMPEDQKDFIIQDWLDSEPDYDIEHRLKSTKGFGNYKLFKKKK